MVVEDGSLLAEDYSKKIARINSINEKFNDNNLWPSYFILDEENKVNLMFLGHTSDQYWISQLKSSEEVINYVQSHNCLSKLVCFGKEKRFGLNIFNKTERIRKALDNFLFDESRKNEINEFIVPWLIHMIYVLNVLPKDNSEPLPEKMDLETIAQSERFRSLFTMIGKLCASYSLEEFERLDENFDTLFKLPYD